MNLLEFAIGAKCYKVTRGVGTAFIIEIVKTNESPEFLGKANQISILINTNQWALYQGDKSIVNVEQMYDNFQVLADSLSEETFVGLGINVTSKLQAIIRFSNAKRLSLWASEPGVDHPFLSLGFPDGRCLLLDKSKLLHWDID